MTQEARLCPQCGQGDLASAIESRPVRADDGTELEFSDVFTKCASCGNEFYTREQSLAASRARATALRNHDGFLGPEGIKKIREKYGVSQAQLETVLGVGSKTVVRWERGTVCQSRAVDTLLRTFDEFPFVFWHWAESRGVEIKLPFGPRKWESTIVSVRSGATSRLIDQNTGDWDIAKLQEVVAD